MIYRSQNNLRNIFKKREKFEIHRRYTVVPSSLTDGQRRPRSFYRRPMLEAAKNGNGTNGIICTILLTLRFRRRLPGSQRTRGTVAFSRTLLADYVRIVFISELVRQNKRTVLKRVRHRNKTILYFKILYSLSCGNFRE